ncbi:MAG: exodeoxyribonuclease V subunit alpha [Chitinivibrionales bacterium]|nr:exodeoxyribonuclease V subunit alpha [Chitinivibrionales bacterium]
MISTNQQPPLPPLSYLDLRFAGLMERLHGEECPHLFAAASLTSAFVQQRHICMDLSNVAGVEIPDEYPELKLKSLPDLESWVDTLRGSPVVGDPGDIQPLILDTPLLYLHRYWKYENDLGEQIGARAAHHTPITPDRETCVLLLDRLFPGNEDKEPDLQKVAAYIASQKSLCIITGGPGTGKTTTIAKILGLLLACQRTDNQLRIALSAPTGKAAARLEEAIASAIQKLAISPEQKEKIPTETSTLHRLLGAVPHSSQFRHSSDNPLPFDCVIVDESSMVDLPLMAKLVDAVPLHSRLILLGDKDQLASVEVGAVLGHICTGNAAVGSFSKDMAALIRENAGQKVDSVPEPDTSPLHDCIVNLNKSYRFTQKSGIGQLSRAVNEGCAEKALSILQSSDGGDVAFKEVASKERLLRRLSGLTAQKYEQYFKEPDLKRLFEHLQKFQILCAVRHGPYGVAFCNQTIEKIFSDKGHIDTKQRYYARRPILVTENDYMANLYNGDVGIVMSSLDQAATNRAWFPGKQGVLRSFLPQRLPAHETVFATTVHKSQGSEYDTVLLILPDVPAPILTRELIYTAITRAKKNIEIWGTREVFAEAVGRKITRLSGLERMLWEG